MSLYNIIKKAAMGAILSGSIALGSSGLETKLHAQVEPPAIEWEKTFGGTGDDRGYSVQQTTDGGYIVAGSTRPFEKDYPDVYLLKTNQLGEKQWDKNLGGTSLDYGYSVQQTTDGGYIVAGSTWSFGAGFSDVYLIKLALDKQSVKHANKNYFPPKSQNARNLTLVTHGRKDNADGWVSDTASYIFNNLTRNGKISDWDVWTYD